jgi:hypothetical protein
MSIAADSDEMPSLWTGDADPAVEFAVCSADCNYFIDTYCVIDDAHDVSGEGTGQTRFRTWPAQKGVVYSLMRDKKLCILKARQLGISWVVCAYVLWASLFSKQFVMLISKDQPAANELLRRVKVLFDRLPQSLRDLLPKRDGDSTRHLQLTNGSIIKSMPATGTTAVSYTPSILVIDEAARVEQARKLVSDAKPCIDAGGQFIVFSTANGVGGTYHSIWSMAQAGKNGFTPIFLPWWTRPGRDAAFMRRVRSEATDPNSIPENYPANPIEAFVSSGRARFKPEWIIRQFKANVRDPFKENPRALIGIPELRSYRGVADKGEQFIFAADVAEGVDDGEGNPDFSALHVFNRKTMDQAAVLQGRWEPAVFARYMVDMAPHYGWPEIVVERNNHGHAVLAALKLSRYPRIARGHDGKPGWLSNEITREQSIDALAAYLKDGAISIHDKPTLDEMNTFHVDRRGRSRAVSGSHDDLVMAAAILAGWLNHGLVKREAARVVKKKSELSGYRG